MTPSSPKPKIASTPDYSRSLEIFDRAKQVYPGGVTRAPVQRHPFRDDSEAFPIYVQSGEGAWITDVDGNRYLDFINNYSVLIHGHCFPPVVEAIERQLHQGTCFVNPTERDVELAEIICERVPAIEKIRFVNTGTEAVMFAVKAARAFTGRTMVAKFEGAYHGVYDWVESSLGTTPDNWGEPHPHPRPNYVGTPDTVLNEVVVVPFNDTDTTIRLIEEHADQLACLVIDLIPTRAGTIHLEPDYIEAIREVTRRHGILLISDEVYCFRLGYHGAAARVGLQPDMVTLGKIIGGGLPIGAIGGSAEIMGVFDNSKGTPKMPQGGTFTANPMSMAAGVACMRALDKKAFARLNHLGESLRAGLQSAIQTRGLAMQVLGEGSLFDVVVKESSPRTYRDYCPTNAEKRILTKLRMDLLQKGVLTAADLGGCVSTVMDQRDIDQFVAVFGECLDMQTDIPAAG